MLNNNNIENDKGLLLGPAYQVILNENPSVLSFDISGKKIFYLSGIDAFLKTNHNLTTRNAPDSLVVGDWIIKDSWSLFIHKAIYFYHNKKDSIEINYRPDTIFAPKRLYSTIKFENMTN